MHIQNTTIAAEQALTRDTVAVGVGAIVFWQVENAEFAAIRVTNYREAFERVAQTSLREMIGASELKNTNDGLSSVHGGTDAGCFVLSNPPAPSAPMTHPPAS